MSKSGRPPSRTRCAAAAIVVSVRRPRKSNLIRPIFSTQRMSNCVTTSPDFASRVERHGLDQRVGADHDAGGVRARVAREALELARGLEQLAHLAVGVDPRAQLGRLLERLVEA